jgi:hypothetical protein
MANLKLYNPDGVNLTRLGELFIVVPIGATGAVGTYVLNWGFGIASTGTAALTRTGVGAYTAQLSEPWAGDVIWYGGNTKQATVAAGDGLNAVLTGSTIATNGQFTFIMLSNSSVAAEIRSGATLYFSIGLKNNTNYP